MVKNILIVVALLLLLFSVLIIYNARAIVKEKTKIQNQNNIVIGVKVLGYIFLILSLILICYLKK